MLKLSSMLTLYTLLIIALLFAAMYQIELYNEALRRQNDLAVRHRNFAILYGILCIIMCLGLLLNTEEFLSVLTFNKQFQNEGTNAITSAFVTGQSLVSLTETTTGTMKQHLNNIIPAVISIKAQPFAIPLHTKETFTKKVITFKVYILKRLPLVHTNLS